MSPTLLTSRNLIFNTEFPNFIIPGNFQKFSGTLIIAWKWAIFCQFYQIGHQFNLIFVTEFDFCLNIKKISCSDAIPGQYPEFQETSESFQEWWNFEILNWKSSFLTNKTQETQVLSCPAICWIHYIQIALSISAEHLSQASQHSSKMFSNAQQSSKMLWKLRYANQCSIMFRNADEFWNWTF